MSDFESISGKQKVFVPFTVDKRFWDKTVPIVFFNKVYEEQVEDKEEIQFTTLVTSYTYKNDDRFQRFCIKLTEALGMILNRYHGLNESNLFWRKLLYLWIVDYATGVRFKIEQFNHLEREYPKDEYLYCSLGKVDWEDYLSVATENIRVMIIANEEYHFFSYIWLAKKYYGFQVKEICVEKDAEQELSGHGLHNFLCSVYEGTRAIGRKLMKAFPRRLRVGTYRAEYGLFSSAKWFLWSRGAIQKVDIALPQMNCRTDWDYRNNHLVDDLTQYMDVTGDEKIFLEFLPNVFPKFFLEEFKTQYDAASHFLENHPNLVIMYTLTGMVGASLGKIIMLLLQKRGGKVIGQQHGGTYQVTTSEQEHMRELEWHDMFYYWGKSALTYRIEEFPDCKILYGPSYKFFRGKAYFLRVWTKKAKQPFSKDHVAAKYFLFVGTVVEAYPRANSYGNVDGEKWEYIQRKYRFLSSLSETARRKMIVREFPKDYGWHMKETIENQFPNLRISFNEGFNDLLDGCSLFISDVLSTPWIEAIYIGKPVIFLLFDYEISIQNYKFRKEEKQYIEMLEKVGVIVHSPEETAELVNYLADYGIMEWWMDEERQRVIRLVRERWTTKVDDIDDWWYQELVSQADTVEQGV